MMIAGNGSLERKCKMNDRIIQLFALCLPAILLFAGCAPKDKTSIPVTGAEDAIPAQVEQARVNVLEYVISSSRLANIPPNTDWQFDNRKQLEGEYHFLSGDWLMIVRAADTDH